MSVASRNPFALLDAEGSRPTSPSPKSKTAEAPPAAQKSAAQKTRGGPASRGGKYYSRGGGAKPPTAHEGATEEPAAKEGQRRFDNRDNRGRGRGGRGGGAGGARGGRRPFDKHSQTGRTDSEKKIHQGWGGDDGNAEFKTEQQATVDAVVEGNNEWGADTSNADAWGAPVGDATADAALAPTEGEKTDGRPRREREPEEDDNTLTLDQYIAQKKEKESAHLPKLEGRQANEGADGNLWKDVVPLEKTGEDAYFAGKTKNAPKARTKKEEKVFLEIDARFDRPDRGRGRGRGGDRGASRGGGRGRGAPRGGRQSGGNAAVNVDDQTAFPSLS